MGFLLLASEQISKNPGMLHYISGGQYKARAPFALSQEALKFRPQRENISWPGCASWRACPTVDLQPDLQQCGHAALHLRRPVQGKALLYLRKL